MTNQHPQSAHTPASPAPHPSAQILPPPASRHHRTHFFPVTPTKHCTPLFRNGFVRHQKDTKKHLKTGKNGEKWAKKQLFHKPFPLPATSRPESHYPSPQPTQKVSFRSNEPTKPNVFALFHPPNPRICPIPTQSLACLTRHQRPVPASLLPLIQTPVRLHNQILSRQMRHPQLCHPNELLIWSRTPSASKTCAFSSPRILSITTPAASADVPGIARINSSPPIERWRKPVVNMFRIPTTGQQNEGATTPPIDRPGRIAVATEKQECRRNCFVAVNPL